VVRDRTVTRLLVEPRSLRTVASSFSGDCLSAVIHVQLANPVKAPDQHAIAMHPNPRAIARDRYFNAPAVGNVYNVHCRSLLD
jgi:hypothetical protein